jgi:hypothetical protein
MTGIILLLFLSILFGLAFSKYSTGEITELRSQLLEKDKELERVKEQHQFEKEVWKNTVKELLGEV